jgi:quercetin dioxygenase-like cupin family protein
MKVERWDPARDGELSESALRSKLEKLGYAVSRYVYPPGTYFPDHTHAVDKIDAVISGIFRITTPEGVADLRAGDAIHVLRGTVHSAEVISSENVVSLDAVKVR